MRTFTLIREQMRNLIVPICEYLFIFCHIYEHITLQADYSPSSFSLSADREYIMLEYATLQVRPDISRVVLHTIGFHNHREGPWLLLHGK